MSIKYDRPIIENKYQEYFKYLINKNNNNDDDKTISFPIWQSQETAQMQPIFKVLLNDYDVVLW